MSEYNNTASYSDAGLQSYLLKVYIKMGLGLLVTAVVAAIGYYTNLYYSFVEATSGLGLLILFFAEIGIAIVLTRNLATLKPATANLLFYAYAAITGFTFTVILMAYNIMTVFLAFAFAALLFGSSAIIGYTTHRDLSRFSTLMMGGLIALMVASVVSMFVPALRNSLLISYLGIIIFLALTAWDMQRIKTMYLQTNGNMGGLTENLSIYGALELYLDFINIFLYVIRILGRNSSNN
jgi:FtsH-binding integral membrane protein